MPIGVPGFHRKSALKAARQITPWVIDHFALLT